MRMFATLAMLLPVLTGAAGCGLHPDPPPQFEPSDFGGTGKEMAACMQYASQSTCELEIWGGGKR